MTGQWGACRVKNATLSQLTKKFVFSSFSFLFFLFFFFFDKVSNFRNRVLTSQKPGMTRLFSEGFLKSIKPFQANALLY